MPPLPPLLLSYDLASALGSLRTMARREASSSAYLPRDLLCAAIAFTVQLAIESGHDAQQLRTLESQLIASIEATVAIESGPDAQQLRALESQLITSIEATGTFDRAMSEAGQAAMYNQADGAGGRLPQLTDDEIISVRDALLAKGDIGSLSIHDQNLFRDCDIALGVVRCQPQTRVEARARVSRDIRARLVWPVSIT